MNVVRHHDGDVKAVLALVIMEAAGKYNFSSPWRQDLAMLCDERDEMIFIVSL